MVEPKCPFHFGIASESINNGFDGFLLHIENVIDDVSFDDVIHVMG